MYQHPNFLSSKVNLIIPFLKVARRIQLGISDVPTEAEYRKKGFVLTRLYICQVYVKNIGVK